MNNSSTADFIMDNITFKDFNGVSSYHSGELITTNGIIVNKFENIIIKSMTIDNCAGLVNIVNCPDDPTKIYVNSANDDSYGDISPLIAVGTITKAIELAECFCQRLPLIFHLMIMRAT